HPAPTPFPYTTLFRSGVDVTKPEARLTEVYQGTGEQAGELLIYWRASDRQLASRPIGLSFAEKNDGPWTTIATGLPADLDHYARSEEHTSELQSRGHL